jgi:hypothetical protein
MAAASLCIARQRRSVRHQKRWYIYRHRCLFVCYRAWCGFDRRIVEGVLLHDDLGKIWRTHEFPTTMHAQLLAVLRRFDLVMNLVNAPTPRSYAQPSLD